MSQRLGAELKQHGAGVRSLRSPGRLHPAPGLSLAFFLSNGWQLQDLRMLHTAECYMAQRMAASSDGPPTPNSCSPAWIMPLSWPLPHSLMPSLLSLDK